MKLKVIKLFIDRNDHQTVYPEGTILEVQDAERARSLVFHKLAKEYRGSKKAAATLGGEPESGVPGENPGK